MYKLRYPHEVRDIADVPDCEEIKVDEKQLQLAETLVDSLVMSFDEIDFGDRYGDALMELVNEKINGKEIITISDEKHEAPVIDIMDALKASIDAAKKARKGA